MDRIEELFNLAEAILWSVLGLGMAVTVFRDTGTRRRILSVAAAGFVLFGISDLIEIQTGSWWEAWWLLALKVGCVAVLILALRAWIALSKNKTSPEESSTQETLRSAAGEQ